MAVRRVVSLAKRLEDPKNPLLGPVIKGLYLFGLWQSDTKYHKHLSNIFHFSGVLFFISQIIDNYLLRYDLNYVLGNMAIFSINFTALVKCYFYIYQLNRWKQLVAEISEEEQRQIDKRERTVDVLMKKYTKYARNITYFFWIMITVTGSIFALLPLLRYVSSKSYRSDVIGGIKPIPQIMFSWFPFDEKKMPGYVGAVVTHVMMIVRSTGVLGVYDMNAVNIMCYLKGQLSILREKSRNIFEDAAAEEALSRIRECHKHHNILIKHYKMFNELLSPAMFVYFLISSITICCCVVQFTSNGATTWQKIWAVQLTLVIVAELFLYCWHSNEVAIESYILDQGIYESNWWKADVRVRRQVLLLAGKFTLSFNLNAGPYSMLSVPTFIDIMRRSYSFYTLISQMQHD